MRGRAAATLGAVLALMITGSVWQPASARTRDSSAEASSAYCPVHYVAHRGEGWPDPNTEDGSKAIRAAIEDPDAYAVESDAWATSDHKAVMQHSDDLSISTDGKGKPSHYTLDYIQQHFTMDDGTTPESVLGYLRQVVHAKQHAILHMKSSDIDGYFAKVLDEAHAHPFVRPMATSLEQARYFVARGWRTELLVRGAADRAKVAAVKAAGVTAVLVVDPSASRTPSDWIRPYIAGGVTTDYVTYSAEQNKLVNRYGFNRVLSADIAVTASVSGCPATPK